MELVCIAVRDDDVCEDETKNCLQFLNFFSGVYFDDIWIEVISYDIFEQTKNERAPGRCPNNVHNVFEKLSDIV